MSTGQFRTGNGGEREWDRVFTALAAEPRRQLVYSLREVSPQQAVTLPDAAMSPTMETDLDSLGAQLHHRHLPLLEDGGFVRWEREPFRARRGPRYEDVAAVFEALRKHPEVVPDHLIEACPRLEDAGSAEE